MASGWGWDRRGPRRRHGVHRRATRLHRRQLLHGPGVRSPLLDALDQAEPARADRDGLERRPEGLTEILEFVASRTGESRCTSPRTAPPIRSTTPTRPATRSGSHTSAAISAPCSTRSTTTCRSRVTSCGRCSTTSSGPTGTTSASGSSTSTSTPRSGVRDSGRFLAELARTGVLVDDASATARPRRRATIAT